MKKVADGLWPNFGFAVVTGTEHSFTERALLHSLLEASERSLGLIMPRNPNTWIGRSPGYKIVKKAVDRLVHEGFAEWQVSKRHGLASTLIPTDRVLAFASCRLEIDRDYLGRVRVAGKYLPPTPELFRINDFSHRMVVEQVTERDVNGRPIAATLFRPSSLVYDRLFIDNYEEAGRLYSNFQSLTSAERRNILLDGEETIEWDYASHGPRILWHLEKIDPPGSPYLFEQPELRAIAKHALTVLLAAENRRKAEGSLFFQFPDEPREKLLHVLNQVAEFNKPIAHRFYGAWKLTQNRDSEIAVAVLTELFDLEVPALAVHDSFIVRRSDSERLFKTMTTCYQRVIGTQHLPKIK